MRLSSGSTNLKMEAMEKSLEGRSFLFWFIFFVIVIGLLAVALPAPRDAVSGYVGSDRVGVGRDGLAIVEELA